MSRTVDERVVEMRFDNKNFEKNVSTTMSTLEKLKSALSLKGAAKEAESEFHSYKAGFISLKDSVNKMWASWEHDIAYRMKNIVKAFTIDPIKTGFQEYETQMGAIQTILANTESKGSTLKDVNAALDELNTYADKTIYNFTEMTRNIGTFTAAGVDLDKSVSSIKGIANLAAVSGSTSQQASTAMYQLSQAMASGTVKLMDWNSVVNAGMGGQVFQDALKRTAKAHGVAIDDIIKKNGSFRESLSDGWLTTEILTDTLTQFTMSAKEGSAEWEEYKKSLTSRGYTEDQAKEILKLANTATGAATEVKTFTQLFDTLKESAQSGWSQTMKILVGDFEEAKELFTKISDTLGGIIGASADARNDLLTDWKTLGGRNDILDSFANIFEALKGVINPVREAFKEIFPPMTAERLKEITGNIAAFTSKLKLGDVASENLKRTARGLFSIISILVKAFKAVYKILKPVIGLIVSLAGEVLELAGTIGDWFTNLNTNLEVMGSIERVLQNIADKVKKVLGAFKEKIVVPGLKLIQSVLDAIKNKLFAVSEASSEMKDGVTSAVDGMGSVLKECVLYKVLESIWNLLKAIGRIAGKVLGTLFNGLIDKVGNADFDKLLDIINSISIATVGIFIAKLIKSISSIFESVGDFTEGLVDILDGVRDCLKAYQTQLKAKALINIAIAVAILTASLLVLSSIDEGKLFNAIAAISALMVALSLTMKSLSKIGGGFKQMLNMFVIGESMKRVAVAMLILSVAVKILSSACKDLASLSWEELAKGLVGVAALAAMVVAMTVILSKNTKRAVKGAVQMVIFAAAIKILVSACEDLAHLSWGDLAKGLVGVGVLLAEIALFLNFAKFSRKSINTATGMVILAAAIKILAGVCGDFGRMDWGGISKGLVAIGVLLAELMIFTNLAGKAKHILKTGVALIAISAAIKILASAMSSMADLSWTEIAKGLVAMAGSLAAIVIALRLVPKNLVGKGIGLIAIATAITILSSALAKTGSMSWESIAKGLVSLGGALAIIAIGLKAMSRTLKGTLALMLATVALAALVPVLGILGSFKWSTIVKGLVAIAGAFAVIGIAGALLSPIIVPILGLAAAMVLIGIGTLAAGLGLVALGAGLSSLAVGLTAIVASLGVVVTGIVNIVAAVIVGIIKGIGEGIIAFCEVIINSASYIGKAIKTLITECCNILLECAPELAETALALIVKLLEVLVQYTPKIVSLLADLIVSIIDSLITSMPKLIGKFAELIGAIVECLMDAFSSVDTGVIMDGIITIGLIAVLVHLVSSVTKKIPKALVGLASLSLVILELGLIFAAFGALAQIPGVEWIISEGASFMKLIGDAMLQSIVAFGLAAALMVVASLISSLIGPALVGIAGLALIIAEMTAVFALFGALAQIPGLQWLVEEGGAFIATVTKVLGEIIGSFVGGLIGGVGIGITDSLVVMAQNLSLFMQEIQPFIDGAMQIDPAIVSSIAALAGAVLLLTGADVINSIASFITGGVNFSGFASDIVYLGRGLKAFSEEVEGVDAASVSKAVDAAKALVEMTNAIPNSGGIVSWFAGDNSIAQFATEIVTVGRGLKGFSDEIAGIVPENIVSAANAAKALAEMTSVIPNSGGMAAWFAGDNSISRFSSEIVNLGWGLKGFSVAVMGVNPESVIAGANAAKAIAEMADTIPNTGGMVAWFTGDNSISKFAGELPKLGMGLRGFSVSAMGINPEVVMAAANAAKALAEMADTIPNSGGMAAWFAGDNSITKFAGELPKLGTGLRAFSVAATGVVPETVTAAAKAAKSLAEMTEILPNEGGMRSWFSGDTGIALFADNLPKVGSGLKKFAESVTGIKNPEALSAAAQAAKALAEMTAVVPNEGGIKSWFSGDSGIASFTENIPKVGKGLKGFSDSVKGISPENVTAGANAAKSLAEMADKVPKKTSKIVDFGENLVDFGKKLKSYFSSMKEVGEGSIKSSDNAFKAVKEISTIDSGNIKSVAKALDTLTDSIKTMKKNLKADLKAAGKEAIEGFVKSINDKIPTAEKACKTLVSDCATAITNKVSAFENAGRDLVKGFANGISANTYRAEAKAAAMAEAAAKSARAALDINSPSKVFRDIGYSIPEGLAVGIDKMGGMVAASSESMGDTAMSGLKRSISGLANVISGDMDVQPTIRPVLDLSDVRSGAGSIGRMFGTGASIGVAAHLSAISSSVNRQNGRNDDVISAIDKLRDDLKNVNNTTYMIDGITYDDGSNITEAVKSLVRAAKIERRV